MAERRRDQVERPLASMRSILKEFSILPCRILQYLSVIFCFEPRTFVVLGQLLAKRVCRELCFTRAISEANTFSWKRMDVPGCY
jgi:hypothetical protein